MPLPKASAMAMSSREYGPTVCDFVQVAVHYPCSYDCNPSQHMYGVIQHVCARDRATKNELSQEELRWRLYEKKAKNKVVVARKSPQPVWDGSQLMVEDPKDDKETGRASLEDKRGAFSEGGSFKSNNVVSFPSGVGLPVVTAGLPNPIAFGSLHNVFSGAALELGGEGKGCDGGEMALVKKKEDMVPNVGGSSTGASISIPRGPRAQVRKKFLANLTEAGATALLDHKVFKQHLKLAKDEIMKELKEAHEKSLRGSLTASVHNPNVASCFGNKTARLIEEYKARIKAELEAGYKSGRENMTKPESMAAACKWTDADVRTFISSNSDTRRVVEDVVKTDATKLFEEWKTEYKADFPARLREHTTPETIAATCGWTDRQTRDFIANNPTAKRILTENVKAKLGKLVEEEKVKFKELIHTQFEQEVEEQVNLKIAKYREEEEARTAAAFDKGSKATDINANGLMSMQTQTSAPSATAKHPLFGLGSAGLSQNNLHLAALNAMKPITEFGHGLPTVDGYRYSSWYSTPSTKRTRGEDLERADPKQKRMCGDGGSKL